MKCQVAYFPAPGELSTLRVVKDEAAARKLARCLTDTRGRGGKALVADWWHGEGCGDVFAVYVDGVEVASL